MSDSDDTDLENLRQLALSSLLKNNFPVQTSAVFYRPVSNSNLISIQPVEEIQKKNENDGPPIEEDDDNGQSDDETSSGSEYAVVEEGLSVSSGDVDQVIEEVVVSEGENMSSPEEEEAEDAVSLASHDSFDEILNSVEEEIRGSKKRTSSDVNSESTSGPTDSKRLRTNPEEPGKMPSPKRNAKKQSSSSPCSRDRREQGSFRQRLRRPLSPHSGNHYRRRRSKSPACRRYRPPFRRRPSPPEKRQSKTGSRKECLSPITFRESEGRRYGQDSHSRSRDRWRLNSKSRLNAESDSARTVQKRRSEVNGSGDGRSSSSPSRRSILSFGDHRLRVGERDRKGNRNYSRHASPQRNSRSPLGNKGTNPKSAKEETGRSRSPSSEGDLRNLTEEQRLKIRRRKMKFESGVSQSGKVSLKSSPEGIPSKSPKEPIALESKVAARKETNSGWIPSRLGAAAKKSRPHEDKLERDAVGDSPRSGPNNEDSDGRDDFSGKMDSSKRPTAALSKSPFNVIHQDDLRTKLEQKRAANVGRIFSVALKDTFHAEPPT